ncbi:MAG: hypothetical protein F6J98_30150 [Moorea sp. SIO4G2]|nr:hypothetical protein [Moorena sp. SIO4G2]
MSPINVIDYFTHPTLIGIFFTPNSRLPTPDSRFPIPFLTWRIHKTIYKPLQSSIGNILQFWNWRGQ